MPNSCQVTSLIDQCFQQGDDRALALHVDVAGHQRAALAHVADGFGPLADGLAGVAAGAAEGVVEQALVEQSQPRLGRRGVLPGQVGQGADLQQVALDGDGAFVEAGFVLGLVVLEFGVVHEGVGEDEGGAVFAVEVDDGPDVDQVVEEGGVAVGNHSL